MTPFHPPAAQPIQAAPHGSLPKAIPAVRPLALSQGPPNQAVPEGVEMPTQPFQNNVMMFRDELAKNTNATDCKFQQRQIPPEIPAGNSPPWANGGRFALALRCELHSENHAIFLSVVHIE